MTEENTNREESVVTEENTNIEEEKKAAADSTVHFVIEEGKKIAKEDFAKFSAIAAVFFSIGLWSIKSIWYAYWSGKFWVYKIDRCYIDTGSENVFLQIIQLASFLIVWLISNFICYIILGSEDKSKFHWKKIRNILGFVVAEIGIIFVAFFALVNIQWRDIIYDTTVPSFLIILGVLIFLCVVINIFAIEYVLEEHFNRKMSKKTAVQENVEMTNEKRIKEMLFIGTVTMSIIIIGVFLVFVKIEYIRSNYKVIMIQSEEETGSAYDIVYAKDNNKYKVFPVAYENQDCFIVTRLYNANGKIKIDYDYQKILSKDEFETIYVDNVYQISTGK